MEDAEAPAAAQVAAANAILDRAHGKPKHALDVHANGRGPVSITYVANGPAPEASSSRSASPKQRAVSALSRFFSWRLGGLPSIRLSVATRRPLRGCPADPARLTKCRVSLATS